ncbi:MAG: DUF4336 domain-containing protein [bacterium]|nr:DUF4336 domain-containing protein [bacterium]
MDLLEFVPGQIWIGEYPVSYSGCSFNSRMTVVRLGDGRLWIHSPGPIDSKTRREIKDLGPVAYIIAPGSFHHLHVPSSQHAFPEAETHVCPGVPRKRPELRFDGVLDDEPDSGWQDDLDQVVLRGSVLMSEVAFFHKPSRTLILVDSIENFTDQTPGVNWVLKVAFGLMFLMWGRPKPAPEYQLSWYRPGLARHCMERILKWDFDRVVLSHGDIIEKDAEAVVRRAWQAPLRHVSVWTLASLGVIAFLAARLVRFLFNALG